MLIHMYLFTTTESKEKFYNKTALLLVAVELGQLQAYM